MSGCFEEQNIYDQASAMDGVTKVLDVYGDVHVLTLAENMAPLIKSLADKYSHILAPATTFGKDFMPRAAALLDISQISDIVGVVGADTFVRPIYAGNALATVKSNDAIKLITVRPSAFDKSADGGSDAAIESVSASADSGLSSFVVIPCSAMLRRRKQAKNHVHNGRSQSVRNSHGCPIKMKTAKMMALETQNGKDELFWKASVPGMFFPSRRIFQTPSRNRRKVRPVTSRKNLRVRLDLVVGNLAESGRSGSFSDWAKR